MNFNLLKPQLKSYLFYLIFYIFNFYLIFTIEWSKESHTDEDLVTTLLLTKLEKQEPPAPKLLCSMFKNVLMVPELLMIVATVGKESTESLNLDPSLIRNCPRDKKLCQDPTVVSSALDALSQESSEHSYLKKSSQSNKPRELPKNDCPLIIQKYVTTLLTASSTISISIPKIYLLFFIQNLMQQLQPHHTYPGRQQSQGSNLNSSVSSEGATQSREYSNRFSQKIAPKHSSDLAPILNNKKSGVFQNVEPRKVPQHNSLVSGIIYVVLLVMRIIKFLLFELWKPLINIVKVFIPKAVQAWGFSKILFIVFLLCFILLVLPVGQPVRNCLFQIYTGCIAYLVQLCCSIKDAWWIGRVENEQGIY